MIFIQIVFFYFQIKHLVFEQINFKCIDEEHRSMGFQQAYLIFVYSKFSESVLAELLLEKFEFCGFYLKPLRDCRGLLSSASSSTKARGFWSIVLWEDQG